MNPIEPENRFLVAALYKFVTLSGFRDLRQPLQDVCEQLGIRGTLLLAAEGINGTVAGSREAIVELIALGSRAATRSAGSTSNMPKPRRCPSKRMKVRIKEGNR